MQNQAPLSPARALYEELCETEEAGSFNSRPAPREADAPTAASEIAVAPLGSAFPGPEDIPELTPELATRRSAATNYGDLAAIIRLQSTEIERLALENDRLAAHLSMVNQLHENEQNQRWDLERQLREARVRIQPPAPAFDVEEIRRAAREGMSTEIKPVLVAILDLLETALPRGTEATTPSAAQVSAQTSLVAEVMDDFHRLPEILTRPLEELMNNSGNAGPAPEPAAELPAPLPPQEPRARRPRPSRHEPQPNPLPSVFAWTTLF